jgi:hypothetical protein
MEHSLSKSVKGFTLQLKTGENYKLGVETGERLEKALLGKELPNFINMDALEDGIINVSVSMIAVLKRDIDYKLRIEDYI